MSSLSFLMVALALAAGTTYAQPPPDGYDRQACKKVRAQIRRVHSRMRAGYSARQGVRLDERLRELKRRRSRVCR